MHVGTLADLPPHHFSLLLSGITLSLWQKMASQSQSSVELHSMIESLPAVVATHVLSYLQWNDKLNVGVAIPSWEDHLHSPLSWSSVIYKEVSFRALHERNHLSECFARYGQYVQYISITFCYALGRSGAQILKEIKQNCTNLLSLEFTGTIWDTHGGSLLCQILSCCSKLKDVSLVKPSLVWGAGETGKDSVLVPLVRGGHAVKVTKLILCSESLIDHDGPLDVLRHFTHLRTLRIRREELSEPLLLHLASHSLSELSIYQDEEMPLSGPVIYTADVWEKIHSQKPAFHVNLVLTNIVLLRSLFPAVVPIRALVLVDLSASLTKGILDTISNHYQHTLEVFVYSKSYVIGCANLEDRRLPIALLDLVHKCHKLHTLIYGFEISSTTALLLAHKRRLTHLVILLEEMSFEFDWCHQADWTPTFTEWLRSSGKSMVNMEREISKLLGYEWRVATEHSMFQNVNHFINI